jgi:ABC-2 type transport system permease protein
MPASAVAEWGGGERPSSPLRRFLQLYMEFGRVGFVNALAYRLRYFTGIVTYFIYVSVYYFIWKAIYEHSKSIEGFDFSHLLTYIGVGWIIRSFYFNNIDQELAYQVIEGRLAMDLIKPVNIQLMYVARAAGESVFRLVLLTAPTALLLFIVFPLRLPSSARHMAVFVVSVALSFLIVAAVNFIVGTFALRLQSILGLLRAKFFLLELFSGLLLPISFFPGIFQRIFGVLPFEYISYVPMLIYLGKLNGSSLLRGICIQIFWVAVLLAIGNAMWSWSSRKVTIQGG